MIIAEGLERCGPNTVCLRDYLYSVKKFQGVTGNTAFDDKGDVVKTIVAEAPGE